MPAFLDHFLNGITMYRLMLHVLTGLAVVAIACAFLGFLTYSWIGLLLSVAILVTACGVANWLLALLFRAPTNHESARITGLILFFVMAPVSSWQDAAFLALAAVVAMASKYVVAIRKQHLFNPAAFAAVVVGIPTGLAYWWVGTPILLPFTLIAALLIVRKVRRFEMFAVTVVVAVATLSIFAAVVAGTDIVEALVITIASWPIVFFASVMVTEPVTAPGTRRGRLLYGAFVGAFSSLPLHVGIVWSTPELTLLIANAGSFLAGLRRRLTLRLTSRTEIARDTFELAFEADGALPHRAGQYLEWTLPHAKHDARSIRRYFTVASAPGEPPRIGVKMNEPSSSFKARLREMVPGDRIWAGSRGGDFVLPQDPARKLAFVAGGIGVTPFASMLRHLLAKGECRDIVLFYAARTAADVAYRDLLAEAREKLGLRTVIVLSDEADVPGTEHGRIDAAMLARHAADLKERDFYLSGPDAMVQAYKRLLRESGVARRAIRTDYFPGF